MLEELLRQNKTIIDEHPLTKLGGRVVSASAKNDLRFFGLNKELQQMYWVTWEFEKPVVFRIGALRKFSDLVWFYVPLVRCCNRSADQTVRGS